MGDRNLDHGFNFAKGLVYIDFSYAANNTSNPLTSTWRGAADAIASVTRSGVGIHLVTLKDKWRYVVAKTVDLEDLNASDDGAYATVGAVQNEGSSTTAPSFNVYTRAAAGTKTDYASPRRVSIQMVLKNSTVGV